MVLKYFRIRELSFHLNNLDTVLEIGFKPFYSILSEIIRFKLPQEDRVVDNIERGTEVKQQGS